MNYKLIFGLFLIALVSLSFSYDLCPKPVWKEPICDYWIPINQICADTWGLDPYFVAAIVKKESDFNPLCVNEEEKQAYESGNPQWCGSYYGKGLMQLTGPGIAGTPYPSPKNWKYDMPAEADPAKAPYMDNAFDPTQNLSRGCWFLKALSDHYSGNLNKVASAYRYGWQDVDQLDGLYVGPYNNNYVLKVMDHYKYYKSSAPAVAQPTPVETTIPQPPVQQEPALTQPLTPTNTQTTTTPPAEKTPDKPSTVFCNKLKMYLETKHDKFFKKLYWFLGKDSFKGYCKNNYCPILSTIPKQLKKMKAKIELN